MTTGKLVMGFLHAVEHQSLRSMGTGRTPEGMALNSAFRRRVGANTHQAHLTAARQALLHSRPRHTLLTTLMVANNSVVAPYRCALLLGRARSL
jgi:hypothetical protein